MSDQAIPAEKVRELAAKYDGDVPIDPHFLLGEIKADLRALLPSQQPTTGLLGRWAKHPEHGDVLCIMDKTIEAGEIVVAYTQNDGDTQTAIVRLAELAFPHQATCPEDVPENQPWLVDVNEGEQSLQSVVAIKGLNKMWLTLEGATEVTWCSNGIITLIAPLTPERPGESDLQARYDALEQKYTELERKHFELGVELSIEQQANGSSNDWGDEQLKPAWRIEHDWENLREGEYIIDGFNDGGTVTRLDNLNYRDTDGSAYGFPGGAPFIVFRDRSEATPEAIEEAKNARDKETGE